MSTSDQDQCLNELSDLLRVREALLDFARKVAGLTPEFSDLGIVVESAKRLVKRYDDPPAEGGAP